MEAPSRGGGAPLERVWPGVSGSICVTGKNTLSALILSFASSSTWAGCHISQGFVCTLSPRLLCFSETTGKSKIHRHKIRNQKTRQHKMTRLELETRTGNLEWFHKVAIARRVICVKQYSAI